jgi:uncharacterized membrane protein
MLISGFSKEIRMHKLGIVLAIVLGVVAALWLGGAGIVGLGGFGLDPKMMSEISATMSPIYLTLIVAAGMLIIVLLARAPRHALSMASGALAVSKTLFAKGEITKGQLDVIKRDLGAKKD